MHWAGLGMKVTHAVLEGFTRIDVSWVRIEIALLVGAFIMAA